jgi:hypothetical protein
VISGQGNTSPSPETFVCTWETSLHSGNFKKAIKTQSPTWPMGPPVPCSLHSPLCSLSLLFSRRTVFLTNFVVVRLCFHCQSGIKNPEPLKFLCRSSVHHIWWPRRDKPSLEVGVDCAKLEKAP